MGLDAVELVICTEQEFGIDIADADAERLTTPRELANYVASKIVLAPNERCLTQHAFHRVRSALAAEGVDRDRIRCSTPMDDLFPGGTRRDAWRRLRRHIGTSPWPGLRVVLSLPPHFAFPRGCATVGALARHLATHDPRVPTGPKGPWTKESVLLRVRQISIEQLGLYSLNDDDRYIEDLNVD